MKSYHNTLLIGIFAICLFTVLVVFGGSGVRGSDQYWYVADVQSLIEGDASHTSNMYFPGKLLREGDNPTPNYFMHNGVAIHVAALLGRWLDAYHAWLILNAGLHLIAAFLVLACLSKFLKVSESVWIFAVYLLSPIALWQTINPLLEQSYAFITALFAFGYLHVNRVLGMMVLALAIGLGVMSHPIFLFPSLCVILMCCWELYKSRSKADLVILFLVCISFSFSFLYGKNLLPSSFQPSLEAIITSAVPGKSNMYWHYSFEQYPITFDLMLSKFISAIKIHFATLHFSPFFVFTNIAFLLTIWLLLFRFKKHVRYMLPVCIFFGLYATMILLQQNQPRYQQIVAPVTFLVLGLFISEYIKKIPLIVKSTLVVAVVAVNLYVLNVSSKQSVIERDDIANIQRKLADIDGIHRLAIFDMMPHNPVSYAVRPKPLLAIRKDMLQDRYIEEALIRFGPDVVISKFPVESDYLGFQFQKIDNIDTAIFGDLYVYQIDDEL